jgi:hypothetical protein
MANVTTSYRISAGARDGRQQYGQRATGNIAASDTLPHPPLPHYDTTYAAAFWLIFTVTGLPQGSTINSAKLSVSANNSWGLTARTYIAVENNLDPLGTGAIVAGTAGSAPYPRLKRDASAVTRLGARCGPTHSGNLATTGVPVRDASAYVYKAFADNRTVSGNDHQTDEFGPALQALVNDPGWNSTSQDVLVWMFPDEQTGTTGIGNLAGFTWTTGSGQTGTTTPSFGNGGGQFKMYESSSSTAAQLVVGVEVTPVDGSASVSAPTVQLQARSIATTAYKPSWNVNYQNGTALAAKDTAVAGSRVCDVLVPYGTPPVGGWPVVIHLHGGFFASGNRGTTPELLRLGVLNRNYALVLADYRLVDIILAGSEFLADGNELSFPAPIHDIKVLINLLRLDQLGAQTYNINVNKLILSGFSAGGSLAQFVAYSKGDTATYEGLDSASWNLRPAPVGRTNNTTNYYYDFNQNGMAGIDDFTVKGLFLFAGATSLQLGVDATATPNSDARYAISHGRRAYISRSVDAASIDTTTVGEIDVDKYLAPAAGTPTVNNPYLGKAPVVPDFPIGYVRGTSDILVTKAAGYTPLESGLIANGYISGAPTTNVTNPDGLSYYEVSGIGHDAMEYNAVGISRFFEWLDAVEESSLQVKIGGSQVTGIAVGGSMINAAYIGSDRIG